jgi:hypothetical protein
LIEIFIAFIILIIAEIKISITPILIILFQLAKFVSYKSQIIPLDD